MFPACAMSPLARPHPESVWPAMLLVTWTTMMTTRAIPASLNHVESRTSGQSFLSSGAPMTDSDGSGAICDRAGGHRQKPGHSSVADRSLTPSVQDDGTLVCLAVAVRAAGPRELL